MRSASRPGEISFVFQIPTDYRLWTDELAPQALDYVNGPVFVTQSFSDTLRVTFRLRAESRPSGSISTTGGEAVACFGLASPLGGFDLDDPSRANCAARTGFTIGATTTVTGTQNVEIAPEPATLGLMGLATLGLGWVALRRRR